MSHRHVPAAALALAALVLLVAALASAAPTPAPGRGAAEATGFGAMMDGGTSASALASSAGHVTRNALAQAVAGSAGAIGRVDVSLGAGSRGAGAIAEATATARDVLLLDGRVVVAGLRVSVQARAGPDGARAGLSGYAADGLFVDSVAVAAAPGTRVDVAGVGTLVLFEQVVDGAGAVRANGLRLEVTDPAGGLPLGTQVVVGHVEASAAPGLPETTAPEASPTAPAAPAPPRTAPTVPAAPTTATPPAVSTTTAPREPARPAPRPVTVPDLQPLPAPLALPRREPAVPRLPTGAAGYVFPVHGGVSFIDDYGAPRASTGWHHGNDLFAPIGAPVLAVADGRLSRVGVNRLGGNRLWLTDEQGNTFYYAHLSAYAPVARNDARVSAGEVIAFVGNTGEAITTPPHLHFEIHPGDGDSVDPYPYLLAWQRRVDLPLAFRAATASPTPAPAAGTMLVGFVPARDDAPDDDAGLAEAVP